MWQTWDTTHPLMPRREGTKEVPTSLMTAPTPWHWTGNFLVISYLRKIIPSLLSSRLDDCSYFHQSIPKWKSYAGKTWVPGDNYDSQWFSLYYERGASAPESMRCLKEGAEAPYCCRAQRNSSSLCIPVLPWIHELIKPILVHPSLPARGFSSAHGRWLQMLALIKLTCQKGRDNSHGMKGMGLFWVMRNLIA